MMKKIMSMLMAVVMIISMLPLSIFAAEEVTCPGQGYLHNLTNCDWTEGETVAPECGKHGYTLYECNACHVSFAGNFVDPISEHKWIVDTEAEAPSCTEDGAFVTEKCELCGELKPGTGAVDPATGHSWTTEPVSGNCVDGYVYECIACGATETRPTTENGHVWCEIPTIIVEPQGACQPGKAEYTCTVDGCGAAKVVDIQNVPCDLEFQPGTAATCTTAGVKDHYKCTICGRFYLVEGGDAVEADDLVIPAAGHADADEWIEGEKKSDWSCTTDETYEYKCPNCDATEIRVTKEADHNYHVNPELTVDATCTKYGYTTYACQDCNYVKETVTHEPLGCTELDRATASVYVEPTCKNDGYAVWNCGRCGKEYNTVLPCEGHDEFIKTVTVDATCSKYAYTFTYCSREVTAYGYTSNYCDSEDLLNPWPVTEWTVGGVVYDVAVEGQGVFLLSIDVDVDGGYDADNHTEDPARSYWINKGTCTTDGNKMFYCLDCQYVEAIEVKACNHESMTYVLAYNNCTATTPNANMYEKRIYTCNCTVHDCDWTMTVTMKSGNEGVDGTLTANVFNGHSFTVVNQTYGTPCTGTYDYMECAWCGRVRSAKANKVSAVKYDPTNIYPTVEALLAVHPNAQLIDTINEGDCLNLGLYNYYCADCNYNHPVAIPGTGEGHVAPANDMDSYAQSVTAAVSDRYVISGEGDDWIIADENGRVWMPYLDATCTVDGHTAAYECSVCNTWVESEVIPAVGEHNIVTEVEPADATCTVDGHTGSSKCTKCDEMTVVGEVIPATGHGDWSLVDYADLDCTQFQYYHWACGNEGCDYEFINGYVPAPGHTEVKVIYDATCDADGLKGCERCDVLDEIIPAGHVNAAGEVLEDKCTNTCEDRVCVRCEATIGQAHAALNTDEHPATCTQNAYVIEYCDGCGFKDVYEIEDTMAHSPVVDWDASYLPTHSTTGLYVFVCEFCGKDMGSDEIPMLSGIGFDIQIDNAAVSGAIDTITNEYEDYEGNIWTEDWTLVSDGDVIAVDIYMDAYEAKVWGFNFDMEYLSVSMNFLGYKFHASDLFGKYMVNNVLEDDFEYDYYDEDNDGILDEYIYLVEDAYGTVKVSAYTELELDGKKTDAVITGPVKVVTLYFQVESYYEGIYWFVPEYDYCPYGYFEINSAWMSNSEGAEDYCDTDYEQVEVSSMLDTNNNGVYNIKDLENCYDIIKGVADYEYLAAADANKDGIVDLTDLDIMNQYLVGRIDDLGVYAAMNWTAPEGFIAAE